MTVIAHGRARGASSRSRLASPGRRRSRVCLVAVLGVPALAAAHPLGNFTINHYAGIRIEPDRILLDVVIDQAEIPTFQARLAFDADGDGELSTSETEAGRLRPAPTCCRRPRLTVDGVPPGLAPDRGRSDLPARCRRSGDDANGVRASKRRSGEPLAAGSTIDFRRPVVRRTRRLARDRRRGLRRHAGRRRNAALRDVEPLGPLTAVPGGPADAGAGRHRASRRGRVPAAPRCRRSTSRMPTPSSRCRPKRPSEPRTGRGRGDGRRSRRAVPGGVGGGRSAIDLPDRGPDAVRASRVAS